MIKSMIRTIIITSLLISLTSLSGCIKMKTSIGYDFDIKNIEEIEINKTRKAILKRMLGSPSIKSDYGEEAWFYVFSKYEKFAFFSPKLKEQKVVKVTFNRNTTVKSLDILDKEDVYNIAINEEKTPITSSDMTIIGQILGNVGRFSSGSGALSKRHTPGSTGN